MAISQKTKEEVEDILEMYTELFLAWDKNDDIRKEIERKDLIFGGFDGNYEGKHYFCAVDLVTKNERFPVIYKTIREIDGANLNSNGLGAGLFQYKLMVKKWKELKNQDNFVSLKVSDIEEIIKQNK